MKQSLRISMIAIPILMVSAFLVPAPPARAESPNQGCSDRTLRGDYGFTVEGVFLPGGGVSLPIRGVGMAHYDGAGNFTQVDHIVFNGVAPAMEWTPGTGTYQVNADCTGTARINSTTEGFVNLAFVIVKQGKEIRSVVTAPFDGPPGSGRDVTSVGIKVE